MRFRALGLAVVCLLGAGCSDAGSEAEPAAAARVVAPDAAPRAVTGPDEDPCLPYTLAEMWSGVPVPDDPVTLREARDTLVAAHEACGPDRLVEVAQAVAFGWRVVDGVRAYELVSDPDSLEALVVDS